MLSTATKGNFGHKGFGKDGYKGFGQDGGYGRGKGNAQRACFGCGATDPLLKDCPAGAAVQSGQLVVGKVNCTANIADVTKYHTAAQLFQFQVLENYCSS